MKPSINVTPLIDVLLVLLIIFMVIAPAKPTAFHARVPVAPTGAAKLEPHPNSLIVAVKKDSSLRLNQTDALGTVEDADKLIEALENVFKRRQAEGILRSGSNQIEKTVFIKASKNLNYGSVTRVIDAVKSSGAEPIGLQIDDVN